MKQCFLFFIFILSFTRLYSQKITLSEMFTLCNKSNWDEVNEYLLRKGWEYNSSSKGDDEHYNTITWAFNKQEYSDKAQAWFYLYTYEGYPNKIGCSFFNKASYNLIKSGITGAGMKLIDNSIEDNEIITKYSGNSFIVTVTTQKREQEENYFNDNSITAYSVAVIKKAGVYDNDNGLKKIFDDSGNLESEFTLKDGKINGTAKVYYPNGQLKMVSNLSNGIKQGASKEYDENGNLTGEYNYFNDQPNGLYKIYENGKLKVVGNLLRGKKNGQFKLYDEDGNLDKEYVMKDDALNGNYNEYYYKDNKLVLKNTGQYLSDVKSGLWQLYKIKEKKTDLVASHNYLNGEYDGAFKEVNRDSIIFGTYQNGILNGKYKIYRSAWSYVTGEVTGDTSGATLTTTGNYYNGQKSGYWKHFSLAGTIKSEGIYSNDEKNGAWKYYYEKTIELGKRIPLNDGSFIPLDTVDHEVAYSRKLFLIENYENGKLNGKTTRFSYLQKKAIPCDTTNNKNVNPLDTCFTNSFEKINEISYWKNDKLYGPFELKDSIGILKFKGNFINDLKDGLWIESYISEGTDEKKYYVYQKGNYVNGDRSGTWEEYVANNFVFRTSNYDYGKLNGKTIQYSTKNKPSEIKIFENDDLKSIEEYDSSGSRVNHKFEILSETNNEIKCRKMDYYSEGSISQVYWMKKEEEKINPDYFKLIFYLRTGKFSDGTTGYPDGEYKQMDNKENILVVGNYFKKAKTGIWKYFYYDISVYTEQEFDKDIGGIENFYFINPVKPFSGKFIQKHKNGNLQCEFKISDGLRDGKSKYFDEKGQEIKTEKYNKGILIN